MKLLKQAEYMAATGFTIHPTIAFCSGWVQIKDRGRLRTLPLRGRSPRG